MHFTKSLARRFFLWTHSTHQRQPRTIASPRKPTHVEKRGKVFARETGHSMLPNTTGAEANIVTTSAT